MSFHNVRLPNFLENFAIGRVGFHTSIVTSASGREVRSSDSERSKSKFTLHNCHLSPEEFSKFNSFFRARYGSRYSFLLRDYADYTAHDAEAIKLSDREFQIVKYYNDRAGGYTRIISRPVIESIKIDFSDGRENYDYKIIDNGIIKFNEAIDIDLKLYISFEFDIPTRFLVDEYSYSFAKDGSILLEDLEMIEIME